jgi:hypothetical protein
MQLSRQSTSNTIRIFRIVDEGLRLVITSELRGAATCDRQPQDLLTYSHRGFNRSDRGFERSKCDSHAP